jgi:2-hydroxychromene-2-carboxylate isomerase
MQWTVVALLFCLAGIVVSDPIAPPIPVQNIEPGTRHLPADPRPDVQLEIFVSLNCGDSFAEWPIVKEVQAYYGSDRLDVVFQQTTLPFQRNTQISTQGFFTVEQWDPTQAFPYAEAVLAAYNQFSTSNTVDKTETQVIEELADIAVATTGIDRDLFVSDIVNHRSYTTAIWKYANKRGVAGTPTFFVNGVDVVVGTNFVPSFDEWVAFFDPIINAP